MAKRLLLILWKTILATAIVAAILAQLMHGASNSNFSFANFFSYFTIESTIFSAVLFVFSSFLLTRGQESVLLNYLRGAATVYMAVTGIVYALLLRGDHSTFLPWVNSTLHYFCPAGILLDWLADRPAQALSFHRALWWLAYPLVYLAYTFARGPIAHWYPYPFLDVAKAGYAQVLLTCAALIASGVVLIFVVAKLPRLHPAAPTAGASNRASV